MCELKKIREMRHEFKQIKRHNTRYGFMYNKNFYPELFVNLALNDPLLAKLLFSIQKNSQQ